MHFRFELNENFEGTTGYQHFAYLDTRWEIAKYFLYNLRECLRRFNRVKRAGEAHDRLVESKPPAR